MRMTAAVLHEQGRPAPFAMSAPFAVEQVAIEGPGEGEILVEVRAAGLCHSDLLLVEGRGKRAVPYVGGHEGAGIVREVGHGVSSFKPGDHVVMTVPSGCGHCSYCLDSRAVLCDSVSESRAQGTLPNGHRRLSSANGKPLHHYAGVSSFAQYAVTVPGALVKVDPRLPMDVGALFGCAVITGVGCVLNAAKVRPGQAVAVLGLGGVGLNAVMAAKLAGAAVIIGIDTNQGKFAIAKELGCTHTVSATDPKLVQAVKDATRGGVDFAFEISGAKPAMTTAIAITRKGGEVICVGISDFSAMYEYNHAMLIVEEKALRGSLMGSAVAERDIPRYVQAYLDGKLPVDRLMSGTMKFDEINRNLDLLDRGEVLRQVLLPHG
jgi:alcohol dehydrogenase